MCKSLTPQCFLGGVSHLNRGWDYITMKYLHYGWLYTWVNYHKPREKNRVYIYIYIHVYVYIYIYPYQLPIKIISIMYISQ